MSGTKMIHLAVLVGALFMVGTRLDSQVRNQRFEIGEQYTFFHQTYGSLGNNLLGGRFDVRVWHRIWLTSQIDSGLTRYQFNSPTSAFGGRFLMCSFGLKAGRQRRRIGLFGELRGGFVTWSDALTFVDYTNHINQLGRTNQPLLNVSGTLENLRRFWRGFSREWWRLPGLLPEPSHCGERATGPRFCQEQRPCQHWSVCSFLGGWSCSRCSWCGGLRVWANRRHARPRVKSAAFGSVTTPYASMCSGQPSAADTL